MYNRFGLRKKETIDGIAKVLREKGQVRMLSAKYVRNLLGYAKYRKNTTQEIVFKLRRWYGLDCIFYDGNRRIESNSNGLPVEKVFQSFRIILIPVIRV